MSGTDDQLQFWYCIKHHAVEMPGSMCPVIDRLEEEHEVIHDVLGPYATADEAANALAKAQQRNQEWDSDPNWDD